ncbi:MAG: M23 family metallopeptidase [Comamonadaceae bacterium]|nr:MAG: M23 family metallopeptidase [Comamonadaceae bacterium]
MRGRICWLGLATLLLSGCGREEPATVVLDPATGRQRVEVAAAPPAASVVPAAPVAPADPSVAPPVPLPQVPPVVALAPAEPAASVALPAPAPAPAEQVAVAVLPPTTGDGTALLAARSLMIPVEGVAAQSLQDTYTQRRGSRSHEAIDIMAARGTRVVAVDDGKLVKLFNSVPGGLTAYQFDPQGRLAYYYAHLDRYADGLKEGMVLRRGDLIGYVGSTGNAAPDAPHLHFAVFLLGPGREWWKGEPLNPYGALRNAAPAPRAP